MVLDARHAIAVVALAWANLAAAQAVPAGKCLVGSDATAYCEDGDSCTEAICQPTFCHLQPDCNPLIGTCSQVLTSRATAGGIACRSVIVSDATTACSVISDRARRSVRLSVARARNALERADKAAPNAAKRLERRADHTFARLRPKIEHAVAHARMDTGCASTLTDDIDQLRTEIATL